MNILIKKNFNRNNISTLKLNSNLLTVIKNLTVATFFVLMLNCSFERL